MRYVISQSGFEKSGGSSNHTHSESSVVAFNMNLIVYVNDLLRM